jgi:ankyrin repeat protein
MDGMRKKKISLDAARDTAGLTALHLAVSSHYGAHMNTTALLDGGANVNLTTTGGDTSLHLAVAKGRLDIVTLLLTRNADPTLVNAAGATPLDLARATNKQDIVSVLAEALKKRQAQQQMPPPGFSNRPRPPAP